MTSTEIKTILNHNRRLRDLEPQEESLLQQEVETILRSASYVGEMERFTLFRELRDGLIDVAEFERRASAIGLGPRR